MTMLHVGYVLSYLTGAILGVLFYKLLKKYFIKKCFMTTKFDCIKSVTVKDGSGGKTTALLITRDDFIKQCSDRQICEAAALNKVLDYIKDKDDETALLNCNDNTQMYVSYPPYYANLDDEDDNNKNHITVASWKYNETLIAMFLIV